MIRCERCWRYVDEFVTGFLCVRCAECLGISPGQVIDEKTICYHVKNDEKFSIVNIKDAFIKVDKELTYNQYWDQWISKGMKAVTSVIAKKNNEIVYEWGFKTNEEPHFNERTTLSGKWPAEYDSIEHVCGDLIPYFWPHTEFYLQDGSLAGFYDDVGYDTEDLVTLGNSLYKCVTASSSAGNKKFPNMDRCVVELVRR